MVANECNGQWVRIFKVFCVDTFRKHQSKPTGIILLLQIFEEYSVSVVLDIQGLHFLLHKV
jgi:hypothetical protein